MLTVHFPSSLSPRFFLMDFNLSCKAQESAFESVLVRIHVHYQVPKGLKSSTCCSGIFSLRTSFRLLLVDKPLAKRSKQLSRVADLSNTETPLRALLPLIVLQEDCVTYYVVRSIADERMRLWSTVTGKRVEADPYPCWASILVRRTSTRKVFSFQSSAIFRSQVNRQGDRTINREHGAMVPTCGL